LRAGFKLVPAVAGRERDSRDRRRGRRAGRVDLAHGAETDDGVLVVDLWESHEARQAFFDAGLGAAIAAAGIPETKPARVLPVHNHFQGGGETPGVSMIADVDGLSPDMYDSMTAQMEQHLPHGPGHPAVQHIAAVKENGDLLVVDIWESPEAFGEFAQTVLAPAGQEAGLAPFEPRLVPVYARLKGPVLAG
jgi:heme-degrading monooxygenase HmoA